MVNEQASRYNQIEQERLRLKEKYVWLKDNHGDKDEIKKIGTELTRLTLNQAHIIIDLERRNETS